MTFSKNRRKSKKLGEGFSGLSPIGEGCLYSPKTFSYRRKSNFKFLPLLNERCHINQRKTQDFFILVVAIVTKNRKISIMYYDTTTLLDRSSEMPCHTNSSITRRKRRCNTASHYRHCSVGSAQPSTDGIDMGKSSRTKIDSRAKTNRVDSVRFLWGFLSKTTAGYKTVSSTLLLSEKENPEGTEPSPPDLSLCDLYSLRGEALPQQRDNYFPHRLSEFLEHSTPSQLQTDITITNQPSAGAS